jgi:polyisoprenyl-phosphate glycosyltransferase
MKLSIIIPCYNEEKNIPLILSRFNSVITRKDIEVILVNNGSTDDSDKVLKTELPKYSFARTVKVDVNQGYGFGILTGLRAAKGLFIGWTHADMQTDPSDVLKALDIIESKRSDSLLYVKGKRKGRPVFDQFFTFGMSVFESFYLKAILYEINAQPNIFHRSFFTSWKNPPFDFALDLFVLYSAKKSRLTLVRFPVKFPERIHGTSSWNNGLKSKWKFIKRTIDFSKKLKKDMN